MHHWQGGGHLFRRDSKMGVVLPGTEWCVNILESLAVKLVLLAFTKDKPVKSIRFPIDNTTTLRLTSRESRNIEINRTGDTHREKLCFINFSSKIP